jgi:hypothetical protein
VKSFLLSGFGAARPVTSEGGAAGNPAPSEADKKKEPAKRQEKGASDVRVRRHGGALYAERDGLKGAIRSGPNLPSQPSVGRQRATGRYAEMHKRR